MAPSVWTRPSFNWIRRFFDINVRDHVYYHVAQRKTNNEGACENGKDKRCWLHIEDQTFVNFRLGSAPTKCRYRFQELFRDYQGSTDYRPWSQRFSSTLNIFSSLMSIHQVSLCVHLLWYGKTRRAARGCLVFSTKRSSCICLHTPVLRWDT